jgi:hypothetical protein
MTEKPTWRAAMTREGWALILLLIALFELCLHRALESLP